ncbi:hypothetical protein [Streptomyces sp. NEAU-W12]|uniref:hypothetical protein n=1 Tax=Streptomyces sp. NEAU-W12 TaxID=2994668 RepID=UPI00224A6060|nr:hypothetical protein [Streptomyces sp. NEAU-W12]MCX2927480.1 hypothetical protein [Streptomyces sp. NEAU-W12]
MSTRAPPLVTAEGVPAPGPAGFGDQVRGGSVVTAECLRDDGGRGLENELTDRGGPAALRRDADLAPVDSKADRVHGLSGLTAGEEEPL